MGWREKNVKNRPKASRLRLYVEAVAGILLGLVGLKDHLEDLRCVISLDVIS